MAKDYVSVYGRRPDDPGITAPLPSEASGDFDTETAKMLMEGAPSATEHFARSAQASYDYPPKYLQVSWRSHQRYALAKPLEALTIAAGVAFVFGALWGIRRR